MTTSRGKTYYFSPGFTNWCSCLGFFGKLGGFRFMSSRLFLSISSLSEAIRSCCLQNTHIHKGNSKTVKQTATCSSSKYHWKTSKCITCWSFFLFHQRTYSSTFPEAIFHWSKMYTSSNHGFEAWTSVKQSTTNTPTPLKNTPNNSK